MLIQTKINANIGEIAQGILYPGAPFLFSNLTTHGYYTLTCIEEADRLDILLDDKAGAACHLFLKQFTYQKFHEKKPFTIWQNCNIPTGKGLSSSSADILGVLTALNSWFQSSFSQVELYKMAALIDPTDACLSPALTVINQENGNIVDNLPWLPYSLIWFDSEPNKMINTIDFTKSKIYSNKDYDFYNQLFNGLRNAVLNSNYPDFLFWVTQSAVYNEKFLPKKDFNKLLNYASSLNLGVFVAHSGTVMGLVIPGKVPEQGLISKSMDFIEKIWNMNAQIESYRS